MENQKANKNPAPNSSTQTDGDYMTADSSQESSRIDYKLMAKVIDKQLVKQNRNYARELQKKFKKFIKDNQVNFDRLSNENRRLLKIVEDLQTSQRHLQHQLELHQEREKLAVLREQQDVKRIKDLEDRLSIFLLAPVEKNRITYEDAEQSEIDIQQAEIIETLDESTDDTVLEGEAADVLAANEPDESEGQEYTLAPLDTTTDIEELKTATLEEIEPIAEDHTSYETVADDEVSASDKVEMNLYSDSEAVVEMHQNIDGDSQETHEEDKSRDLAQEQNIPSDVIELEVEAESITDEPLLVEEEPDLISDSIDADSIDQGQDYDSAPGGALVDQVITEDNQTLKDEIIPEDSSLLDDSSEEDAYRPSALPKIAITTSDYNSLHRRDTNELIEEPSTEEIETVGEMPPLDIDSRSSSFQGSEIYSDPVEDSIEKFYDAHRYDPTEKPELDLESLPISSDAETEKDDTGIDEIETSQDDIIELQDVVKAESHSVEKDPSEAPSEEIPADVSIEMPGMQLESVDEVSADDAPQNQTNENLVEEILDSEEEVDTGSFEIIELEEENIISSALDTADDMNVQENQPSPFESPVVPSTEDLYTQSNDTLDETADIVHSTDNSESYFKLGKSACETRNWSEAAKYFDRFVELKPDEPRGHYNLAILYYRLKNYPTARTHAERALTLEYAPANKIMRKIDFRMANESKTDDQSNLLVEEVATDEPIMLNDVVTNDSSILADDETLVYEPDILPDFNIDLADNESKDETEDEPIDLLTPIDERSPAVDESELELPDQAADLDSYLENVSSEQDIEQPGMENVDEDAPEELSPTGTAISSDIDSHVSLLETKGQGDLEIADEQPGMALEGEPIIDDSAPSDIESGDIENNQKSENLSFDPSEIIEIQPQDKPEAREYAGQIGEADSYRDFFDNDIIDVIEDGIQQQVVEERHDTAKESPRELIEEKSDLLISPKTDSVSQTDNDIIQQDTQPLPDSNMSVIEPTRMDDQQENLFEPRGDMTDLDNMVQIGSIEQSDSGDADHHQYLDSEAAIAEEMVESTEETITANKCFSMAMEASQKKDYPEAIACFEQYIEQLPDEPKGYYNLAILHYRMHDYDKASECANRALQLGAKSSQKIIDKIESKRSQVKSEKHTDTNKDVLSNLLNDSLNFPSTGLDGPTGDDETASIWDADELDGDISQSLISDGVSDGSFGNKDDVIVFDTAMGPENDRTQTDGVSPDSKPSISELKITALHRKPQHGSEANDADSIGADDSGLTSPGENGRVQNLFTLGEKAIENNEFLKAIKHFTKVTHLAPEDPRGYYYLALVSCRLKFFETAREHATRAIEMGSEPAKKVLEEINTLQTPS